MANTDDGRKKAASSLLAQIEVWRLEYGRPNGEPRNPDIELEAARKELMACQATRSPQARIKAGRSRRVASKKSD